MAKSRVPGVVHHKPSGQDVVFLRLPDGRRSMVYLGPSGSQEAARRYRQVLADHLAGKKVETRARAALPVSDWPTIGQLVAEFLLHAERYYADESGKPTRTIANTVLAVRALVTLHRDTPTDRFTLRDLADVRELMAVTEFGHKKDEDTGEVIPGTGRKPCRNYVNGNINRVKQVFRWGVERRLVPGSVWHELSALRCLPVGRAGVRETKPVEAVPRGAVDAVLPFLPPTLRAAVELQWHTGMRPAECLSLRLCDIDRSSEDWVYRPEQHKGRWRGHERMVVLGPKAREILRPLLKADPKAVLISPRDAMVERKAAWRAGRASKVPPSQLERDAANAAKEPAVGDRYDVSAYRRAIHRACDLAKVERWSPHRLRHAAGTRLALKVGIEGAAAVLGHADVRVTRRYALAAKAQQALAVMRAHG